MGITIDPPYVDHVAPTIQRGVWRLFGQPLALTMLLRQPECFRLQLSINDFECLDLSGVSSLLLCVHRRQFELRQRETELRTMASAAANSRYI